MKYCFNSVKHKLTSRMGLFDLYGLDFMIDENMRIYLIEVNVNPAMSINCDVLRECLPPLLRQTVGKTYHVSELNTLGTGNREMGIGLVTIISLFTKNGINVMH